MLRPHFWADLRIPSDSLLQAKTLIRPNQVSTSGRQPQIGGSIDSQGGWEPCWEVGQVGIGWYLYGPRFQTFPQILPTYSESPNLEDPRIVQLEEPPKTRTTVIQTSSQLPVNPCFHWLYSHFLPVKYVKSPFLLLMYQLYPTSWWDPTLLTSRIYIFGSLLLARRFDSLRSPLCATWWRGLGTTHVWALRFGNMEWFWKNRQDRCLDLPIRLVFPHCHHWIWHFHKKVSGFIDQHCW